MEEAYESDLAASRRHEPSWEDVGCRSSGLMSGAFSIKSCLLFCTLSRGSGPGCMNGYGMGGLVYGDRVWVVKTSAQGVTSVLEREREDAKKEARRPADRLSKVFVCRQTENRRTCVRFFDSRRVDLRKLSGI